MQGAWLALGPFRLSKPGMAPLLAHLFGGNGTPLEGPADRNFDAGPPRDLNFDPFPGFSPLLGGQNASKCEHSQNHIKHAVGQPKKNMMFGTSCVSRCCFSPAEKCTSKIVFFENLTLLIFARCFLPSSAPSKRTKKHREIEIWFLGPVGPF